MNKIGFILLPLAIALAACGRGPADQTATDAAAGAEPAATPAEAAPAIPQVEVASTTMIHAEPAALPDCDPAVVTLTWDVRTAKPGLTSVKILTGNGKLFTHKGSFGTAQTGPWVKPGSVFLLTSGSDDTELERLTIGGPVCTGS